MKSRKGLWVDYKGADLKDEIKIKDPIFEGVINEVIQGNIFMIRNKKNK